MPKLELGLTCDAYVGQVDTQELIVASHNACPAAGHVHSVIRPAQGPALTCSDLRKIAARLCKVQKRLALLPRTACR